MAADADVDAPAADAVSDDAAADADAVVDADDAGDADVIADAGPSKEERVAKLAANHSRSELADMADSMGATYAKKSTKGELAVEIVEAQDIQAERDARD